MTSKHFEKVPGIVARCIAGETILVPARRRAREMALFTLDEVGTFLWDHLDRAMAARDLASAVAEAFEVDMARAAADLETFLRDLTAAELVREVAP